MNEKKQLSILEFSRLTGIKRDNLRFYDRIGLLKPDIRGENGYRYYTRHQLSSAYLIGGLRMLGVGLDDIKRYSADRTPENMLALFAEKEVCIQEEIEKLRETSKILKQYAAMAREALDQKESDFLIVEQERERIFLCPPVSGEMSEDEAEIFSYEYANSCGINLGAPMGVMVLWEDLRQGGASPAYRYYLKSGKTGNAWKPAGLYAVAYGKYDEQNAAAFYQRLLDFIRDRGMEAAGELYGEFLLNELAVQDPEQYFGRIEIPVKAR